MWVAFANAKATHIFLAKILAYMLIFNDRSFNDKLTNCIISFEQLGPEVLILFLLPHENICCGYLLIEPCKYVFVQK